MPLVWDSTRSSSRVPCTAWRRICIRHLAELHGQAPADQVAAAVEEVAEAYLAAASAVAAGARTKRKGPAIQQALCERVQRFLFLSARRVATPEGIATPQRVAPPKSIAAP